MSHMRLLPAGNARDIYGQTIRANVKKSADARKAHEAAKNQKPKEKVMATPPPSGCYMHVVTKSKVSSYEYVAQCIYCGQRYSSLNSADAKYFTAAEIQEGVYGMQKATNYGPLMSPGQSWRYYYAPSIADPAGLIPKPKLDVAKIDQLAGVEARKIKPKVVIPDLTTCIIGWRGWRVKQTSDGLRLEGLGMDYVWEPKKPVTATCKNQDRMQTQVMFGWTQAPVKPHICPDKNCTCGVWAFRTLDEFKAMGADYHATAVVGTVFLWGRVLECENGYRAERAYPRELWCFDKDHEELGLVYNCPVRSLASK